MWMVSRVNDTIDGWKDGHTYTGADGHGYNISFYVFSILRMSGA